MTADPTRCRAHELWAGSSEHVLRFPASDGIGMGAIPGAGTGPTTLVCVDRGWRLR